MLRIAKAKAAGLFSYIWLIAFVSTFLEFILCPPLIVSLGFVPPTYPDHARFMEYMVAGFLIDNGLDYTQSYVIGWLLSLATFVVLISQTTLIGNQSPSPYIKAAAKKLLGIFLSVLFLEVLRASALDFILINQLSVIVEPFHAFASYVLLPFVWWLTYIRVFEYLTKRGAKPSAVVFDNLAELGLEHGRGSHRGTALLRLFINKTPIAVSFGTFCLAYLAIKALSLLILDLS